MSSTRTAKDDSVFRQERYASSEDFERGLKANAVAKKCSIVRDKNERELLWFIQYLSHKDGGLEAVAEDLIKKNPNRIQTPAMAEIGMADGRILTTDEVLKIRKEFPRQYREQFKLKFDGERLMQEARIDDEIVLPWSIRRIEADYHDCHTTYPAESFSELCLEAAQGELEKYLQKICLDPEIKPASGPWYFPDLFSALCDYKAEWEKEKSNVVVTELGAIVLEKLDFALTTRSLAVVEGNPRLGKSYAARTKCEQNPGKARFIEVPSFNDDAGFFRALARGLGLGNFLNYKGHEIRDRVESVLRTGDLLLVLDEAQRLWPLHNLRRGFPSRIVWIMAMANAGVPLLLISTPQFTASQKAMEKSTWQSSQLTGRIGDYEFLPVRLSKEDLMAVTHAILPEASPTLLKAIAIYAQTSARQLSAVETISKRARYTAAKDNRKQCTDADIISAMNLSVIPSDTKLTKALAEAKAPKRRGRPSGVAASLEPVRPGADAGEDLAEDTVTSQPPYSGNRSIVPANELTEV